MNHICGSKFKPVPPDRWNSTYTVQTRYIAVSFLNGTQKRCPIVRPYGRSMGCFLSWQSDQRFSYLPFFLCLILCNILLWYIESLCPACRTTLIATRFRTTLIATRFRVAVICPIIQVFDLCLWITFFNFIMNYVPIVTFWIFTYHKIWILSIMFCFIWSYWIIYFLACLEVSWRVVS